MMVTAPVYADPVETETAEATEETVSISDELVRETQESGKSCQDSLGAIGWLVCPTTGKISEAVDWLYEKIENILVINPVEMKDGSPIYEVWKYMLGVTNIVFIIFCLVMVYSQLTGLGITNYGLKKTLPKLIVAAILVNLSFLICSLAVDASNIIGASLRGVFTSIEEATMSGMTMNGGLKVSEMYGALAGGSALALGAGVIAFETGAIWMLIPTVLGAIVAVVIGLVTIALRQAVVALLIMISPLAIIAYMLPNTEQWFKKWRQLLTKMLVFYPMFSLLFGASSLAGFAIIASATDGFGVLLGVAVQIFPLFFSWSLMKMSGTVLGTINSKLSSLAARPLAANRAWADSHRELTRQKNLARGDVYSPSLRLMQFLNDRKVAREEETAQRASLAKKRGIAAWAESHYDKNGKLNRKGEMAYKNVERGMDYDERILRHNTNLDEGVGGLGRDAAHTRRLEALDKSMIRTSERLKAQQARAELVENRNAESFYKRMEDAMNAHMDEENGYVIDAETGRRVRRGDYKFHFDGEKAKDFGDAIARYDTIKGIMGNEHDVQYVAATAAQAYDTQKKILETKMQKYFELLPPTRDVEYRLGELTKIFAPGERVDARIDAILPGLRILNQRGDTDLLRMQLENILNNGGGVDLGTHASQALASFLMFEVKDNDPLLRRFGKYINLETAQAYNKNKRQNTHLSLDEYITGEYEDWEPVDPGAPGDQPKKKRVGKSKRAMAELIEGTSLDNVERTAYSNLDDMLKNTYTKDGKLDEEKYFAKREEIETAIGPAFISASLKYLSGSEQLKNAVSFLTGYSGDKPVWEDEKSPLYGSKMAEEYHRRKTIEYLKNQTPSQILGLRSDYYGPLMAHLVKEYEEADTTGWSDEAIAEREEYMKERAEIQTRYGDLPAEEAQEKRKKDFKALREKMAGAQFRQTLDSKGMLNQIYRTRRSGAANNAKNWLRGWLNLDDEALINLKLNTDRDKMNKNLEDLKKKQNKGESDLPLEENVKYRVYDEGDVVKFTTWIEDLWEDVKTDDDSIFYEESLKYLKKELSEESYIVKEYERYRKDDPYADGHMLKEFLLNMLSNLDNY